MSLFDGNTITEDYLLKRGFGKQSQISNWIYLYDINKHTSYSFVLLQELDDSKIECIYYLSDIDDKKQNTCEIYIHEVHPEYSSLLFKVRRLNFQKIITDTIDLEAVLQKYGFR